MDPADRIDAYDYVLPPELIAAVPAENRDASRLLVVDRGRQSISHCQFRDLPEFLAAGDLLILNDTRVVPARLRGVRTATGGKWEGLFLREEEGGRWRILGQTRGHLIPGETLTLIPPAIFEPSEKLLLELESREEGGEWICRPQSQNPIAELLQTFGSMPLPPYIRREAIPSDVERYQTTYAAHPGAVAAPTAGLHFTPELLETCRNRGIGTARVTLHVGLGTFRPVSCDLLSDHPMHAEWCSLPPEPVRAIQQTRDAGKRVVAVGTTSVRTLEAVAALGPLHPWSGETRLFIRPPYPFRVVDALLTNFHLPRSTLLVLVSTFAGRELILRAYEEAISRRYRFFSYGDAMLIL